MERFVGIYSYKINNLEIKVASNDMPLGGQWLAIN